MGFLCLKENAEWLLAKHYTGVQCETTDHVIPWNVMKMRCKKFDDETLEVLLTYLQQHGKAVVYVTPEGEKVGICGASEFIRVDNTYITGACHVMCTE